MVVIVLTDCPPSLKGDLTKWFQEINTGVFVGQVNTRVREMIWKRVCESAKTGQATIAFSAFNEQGVDFHVHNTTWKPIDFDGLKLIMRPSLNCTMRTNKIKRGYSNAAKMQKARKYTTSQNTDGNFPKTYVVFDLETTGVSSLKDKVIEIGAVLVFNNRIVDQYHTYIKIHSPIPINIQEITGITEVTLEKEGKELVESLAELFEFIGDRPLLMHNTEFDLSFLNVACKQNNISLSQNECIDTLKLSKKLVKDVDNFKLTTLLDYFGIKYDSTHRALDDCLSTKKLFDKLIQKFEESK